METVNTDTEIDQVEYYYRVEDKTYAKGVDIDGDPYPGSGPTLPSIYRYPVIRKTKKGVWIKDYIGEKFINNFWNKKFALPTVEEAIESYKARKHRQIVLAQNSIGRANEALMALELGKFYFDCRKLPE